MVDVAGFQPLYAQWNALSGYQRLRIPSWVLEMSNCLHANGDLLFFKGYFLAF